VAYCAAAPQRRSAAAPLRRSAGRGASRTALGLVAALALGAGIPTGVLAYGSVHAVGNPRADKPTFVSTCGVCHTLRAAGTHGTSGPDLDALSLTEGEIIAALSKGRAGVMGRAAAAKYTTRMVSYGAVFTKGQIDDVAAFGYVSTRR
jgi:mono/diheme cytochrome c family protein